MVITPHGLTGALFGTRATSVAGAFALGVISHLLLDRVRHRDYPIGGLRGRGFVALDGAALSLAMRVGGARRRAIAGALGGIAPDLVSVAWRAGRLPGAGPLVRLHDRNHTRDRRGTPLELAQGAVAVTALVLLAHSERARGQRWR